MLGGYTYILSISGDEEDSVKSTRVWFYDSDPDEVNAIKITYFGDSQTFVKAGPGNWRYDDVEGSKVGPRFAGTSLLASGAQSARVVIEQPSMQEREDFGLVDPIFSMVVGFTTGEMVQIVLGSMTADGKHNYAQKSGDNRVFLMDQIWGEVLAEMVTDPPLPTTPTPVISDS
jgi:hypothetical protein